MSQMLNCKPIFKCDHTVDSSAMVQVTLKINYDDGTSNKKNVHMIQPSGEMENILFCVEEFKRAANCLAAITQTSLRTLETLCLVMTVTIIGQQLKQKEQKMMRMISLLLFELL